MERNNRPQGREKHVTEGTGGVHKRGDGLGSGPVGNSGHATGSDRSSASSSPTRTKRSGSGGLIGGIIAALVLLGGGGGLFGLLGGNNSGDVDLGNTGSGYESVIPSANPTVSGNSGGNGGTLQGATGQTDNSVAAGSRAKRTTIVGSGADQVTIMVYMCGTDLESKSGMATNDLLEMSRATLSDNVKVVVYTGGCTNWRNQVVRSDVNQIYEIASGGLKCVNENAGSAAMTNPATLTSFIQWCAERYPANRNELIFWDHGGGSVSGYGYDEKFPRSGSMSLAGIDKALGDAGVTFDFIGFDACLMATVETGLMLDDYADYMIASEETEPGIGWYYTNWLTKLSSNPSMATVEIGRNITDDFVTTCARETRGQSATLSVVDLAELSNTAPGTLKNFSNSLTEMISAKEYSQISQARSGTREFARSSAIDQIDLVHFARNVGNNEGRELASALTGAVKYNRTSSDMTNCYGISIYFPYRKTSNVDAAVNTYNAIGLDESYSNCIRAFASLEVSGQVSTGGTTSALPSLLGSLSGGSGGTDMISGLLGSFLGGDFGSISGLSGSNTGFLSGRALSTEETIAYIAENYFDASQLDWTENAAGETVIALPEEQWALITDLDVNFFVDDGEGYIDLGLDNTFDFDDDGNLLGETDGTWLAVNGQNVAYYHEYTETVDGETVTTGYIPALLNGERVELLVIFDSENPYGTITGARPVYTEGETDTIAKSFTELEVGDTLDFLCDYYTYDGVYQDSYLLGEPMTVTETMEISNVSLGDSPIRVTYRFTDIYQQHYWTLPLDQ